MTIVLKLAQQRRRQPGGVDDQISPEHRAVFQLDARAAPGLHDKTSDGRLALEADIAKRNDTPPQDALISRARQAGDGEAGVEIVHPAAEIVYFHVTADRHLHRAGGDEIVGDARQQAFKREFAGLQKLVSMRALAHAQPRRVVVRQGIAIDDEDIRHMAGKGGCGGQPADTCANNDGSWPCGHDLISYRRA